MSSIIEQIKSPLRSWWTYELLGIVFILLALFVFSNPVVSYAGLVFYFTLTFFVSGVLRIATAISNRDVMRNWILHALGGIVDLGLGVLLVNNFGLTALALAYYVGFFLMLSSLAAIIKSFDLKALSHNYWGFVLVTGIVGVVLSILLITNPILGVGTLILWTALGFLAVGAFYVYLGYEVHRADHFVEQKFHGLRA